MSTSPLVQLSVMVALVLIADVSIFLSRGTDHGRHDHSVPGLAEAGPAAGTPGEMPAGETGARPSKLATTVLVEGGAGGADGLQSCAKSYASVPGVPWRLFDAWVDQADGCALARFVAQYERDCSDMQKIMSNVAKNAGFANSTAWLEAARAPEKGCHVCRANKWEKLHQPVFKAARRAAFAASGGITKAVWCTFSAGGVSKRVPARPIDDEFGKGASTLVFECDVPYKFRAAACAAPRGRTGLVAGLEVANGAQTVKAHARVPLCAFDAPNATAMGNGAGETAAPKVALGACTWTSAATYVDRKGAAFRGDGQVRKLKEWLAAHYSASVRYFLIFEDAATWTDQTESTLWPAVKPFAEQNLARIVPWPVRACGARGDGPWVHLPRAGQIGALSTQTFWGRPAQYAAQNACHRRMRLRADWVAHLDVDEVALPAAGHADLPAVLRAIEKRSLGAVATVSLPHIFYGACPNESEADHAFALASRRCAGKAQPSRTKQIAHSTRVSYIWDHYIRLKNGSLATAVASSEAKLVHMRNDYSFDEAIRARFTHQATSATAAEEEEFREDILPRLRAPCGSGGVSARSCAVKSRGHDVCWCRDSALDPWLPKIANVLNEWYS
ncbi:hypothetical protein M885DRAFT_514337 [Pelagophyceae sp. CCMP2097]|nr:hypothetical protein M885DRAFT_514337 [Pelagophyceae sp. CCMP2097]